MIGNIIFELQLSETLSLKRECRATTTEPVCLEPMLRNKRGRDSERPTHRDEEWPPLATTGESPRTETKTQHGQK